MRFDKGKSTKYLIAYVFTTHTGEAGPGNCYATFTKPITEKRIDELKDEINKANNNRFMNVFIVNMMPIADDE